ncbi:hypothetical protein BD779DRAFT_855688 [Infundibulicybe gibba]|nr:hypothetical protein BD779DRAFT_855688 [Infundibulicybe gibba]
MAPQMGPQESAAELILERYFLAGNFVSAVGYGIQVVLYFTCTIYLWRQRKIRRIYALMLPYMTLLFALSSTMLVAQAHRVELMFVDNKNFPGGPWAYQEQTSGGMVNLLSTAAELALLFLSELFMIWRCWVVWFSVGRCIAYIIILLPLVTILASLAAGVTFLITLAHPTSHVALLGGAHSLAWGSAYYWLILITHVVLTVSILVRLIAHRRSIPTSLVREHTGAYTSLITMMIESSAAYSIIGATCLITHTVNSPTYWLFVSPPAPIQQISGYLIIARLAHGQAWQKDTTTCGRAERFEVLPGASDLTVDGGGQGLYIKPEPV